VAAVDATESTRTFNRPQDYVVIGAEDEQMKFMIETEDEKYAMCAKDRRPKTPTACEPWTSAEIAGRALDLIMQDEVWKEQKWLIKAI